MMRQISWRILALAAVVVMAIPLVVSAQPESIPIGKKGEIDVNQPMRVGATLLQSGHYEVQHAFVRTQHYVVFRAMGSEVARVPCRVLTLGKPARFSFAYRALGPDGTAVLTEIRIEDEPAGHIIALQPRNSP